MTTVPPGYEAIAAPPVRAIVRRDLTASVRAWVLGAPLVTPPAAEPISSGRGGAYRVELASGQRAVVRPYRRGGLLGPLWGNRYVGRTPRPFAELAVTVAARARGVLVPEVLAARVEGRGIYSGTLMTAELPGMVPLLTALRDARDAAARSRLAASAGGAIARMHAAGIYHADLNLGNVLVAPARPDGEAALIDFDRGRIVTGVVPPALRTANLERFARSRRKLDPAGIWFDPAAVAACTAAYERTFEAACAS